MPRPHTHTHIHTHPHPHPHLAPCRLYAILRQMWCMPFEAFLGYLKLLCENSNYKTVPFTVAIKWAMARRLSQKEGHISTVGAEVTPCSLPIPTAELYRTPPASILLRTLCASGDHSQMLSTRHLSLISRTDVEMRVGHWILVSAGSMKRIACIQEMVEATFFGSSRLRLWCSESCAGFRESDDGMVRIPKDDSMSLSRKTLLVRLEDVAVTELRHEDRGSHLEFRYVW